MEEENESNMSGLVLGIVAIFIMVSAGSYYKIQKERCIKGRWNCEVQYYLNENDKTKLEICYKKIKSCYVE